MVRSCVWMTVQRSFGRARVTFELQLLDLLKHQQVWTNYRIGRTDWFQYTRVIRLDNRADQTYVCIWLFPYVPRRIRKSAWWPRQAYVLTSTYYVSIYFIPSLLTKSHHLVALTLAWLPIWAVGRPKSHHVYVQRLEQLIWDPTSRGLRGIRTTSSDNSLVVTSRGPRGKHDCCWNSESRIDATVNPTDWIDRAHGLRSSGTNMSSVEQTGFQAGFVLRWFEPSGTRLQRSGYLNQKWNRVVPL